MECTNLNLDASCNMIAIHFQQCWRFKEDEYCTVIVLSLTKGDKLLFLSDILSVLFIPFTTYNDEIASTCCRHHQGQHQAIFCPTSLHCGRYEVVGSLVLHCNTKRNHNAMVVKQWGASIKPSLKKKKKKWLKINHKTLFCQKSAHSLSGSAQLFIQQAQTDFGWLHRFRLLTCFFVSSKNVCRGHSTLVLVHCWQNSPGLTWTNLTMLHTDPWHDRSHMYSFLASLRQFVQWAATTVATADSLVRWPSQ